MAGFMSAAGFALILQYVLYIRRGGREGTSLGNVSLVGGALGLALLGTASLYALFWKGSITP